jgi:AraC-like DNA-binding protein
VHRNVDYFYSMAKVATRRGEHAQALKFYCQYTAEALRCLRSDAAPTRAAGTARTHGSTLVSDEVSARLPAKYRRAYRYIIENIDREDLTTREVAAEMNVTMRTIQLVFKRALGVTPCGLIRSLRLEGIRRDLLDENGPAASIYDTANRWGLKSRSTLAKGYRKHFNESPSQTIVSCTR